MIKTRMAGKSSEERARRKCRRKFLYYFPRGFQSTKFRDWERNYKWNAHLAWTEKLNEAEFRRLMDAGEYPEIAKRALAIESKTNLLFSFEKMALRDAVKGLQDAKTFAEGLYGWLHGKGALRERFNNYRDMLASLPVKQTRVLTWPVLTIFGFIARPDRHIYLKPTVTKTAARKYHFDFQYSSKPDWKVYDSLLAFGEEVRRDTAVLGPRDMIDIQSFIWVLGSEEYPD